MTLPGKSAFVCLSRLGSGECQLRVLDPLSISLPSWHQSNHASQPQSMVVLLLCNNCWRTREEIESRGDNNHIRELCADIPSALPPGRIRSTLSTSTETLTRHHSTLRRRLVTGTQSKGTDNERRSWSQGARGMCCTVLAAVMLITLTRLRCNVSHILVSFAGQVRSADCSGLGGTTPVPQLPYRSSQHYRRVQPRRSRESQPRFLALLTIRSVVTVAPSWATASSTPAASVSTNRQDVVH